MMAVVSTPDPIGPGPLNEKQWAVLRYSDAVTKTIAVPGDVFNALHEAGFNDQEIVEITITCACYNMVSRFLVSLDVGEVNSQPPAFVAQSHEGSRA